MTQRKFLLNLSKKNPNAVIIGSLGTISYELDKIEHRHRYMVRGGMGCAMGIGLGYALASKKQVIVVIGDGSYMMKQGSINTIMAHKPKNLFVYILQNNVYASTGGQKINPIATLPPKSHFKIVKVK